jgi:hypothetical protein
LRLPQFRVRFLMGIVALTAVAMAVLPVLWRELTLAWVGDAYALWGAGEMVVDHMKDHNGRWPKGWDDLKPYYDAGGGRVAGWSFDEFQRHVTIRWDVDTRDLETAAKASPVPTFRVIAARQWAAGTIGGHEPNEFLHRYFRERSAR